MSAIENIHERLTESSLLRNGYADAVENPLIEIVEYCQKEAIRLENLNTTGFTEGRKTAIILQIKQLTKMANQIARSLIYMERFKVNTDWKLNFLRQYILEGESVSESNENSRKDEIKVFKNAIETGIKITNEKKGANGGN